jgi:hypothetical protein
MEEIFPMLFQAGPDRSISPHQSRLRTSKRCQETPNLPVSLGWSHVGPGRGRAVGIPLVHISLGALAADGAAGGPYAKPLRGTDAVESVTTFWECKDRTLSYLTLANYTTHHIRLKAQRLTLSFLPIVSSKHLVCQNHRNVVDSRNLRAGGH